MQSRRIVVGITGATGVIYGVRLLERLREVGVETDLVLSRWGVRTLLHETRLSRSDVEALATTVHAVNDMGASISSGSYRHHGMVVAPCSARTLAAIAHGYGDGLIHRAADVTLKERRPLVLLVREAPLSVLHLENMLSLARMGAVILPPVPAFYQRPRTIDDLVNHSVARVLDSLGIDHPATERWNGELGLGGAGDDEAPVSADASAEREAD
jgi:4-hydroxy-3-polyprenylbenzoate decarboxylase